METSRMSFGPKTLPHLRTGTRFPLMTKLSLFPMHLLQKLITISRRSTKHYLCVKASSETSGDIESIRPLPHVAPTLWGDRILSVPTDNSEFDALATEIESFMKPKVRNMLMSSHITDKERIRLIHVLICLGTSHYFEKEIEEILDQAFRNLDTLIAYEDDLETTAIMFEVFRLYGHRISCDVFDRFKGVDAKFIKEHIVRDIRGILQLYEAAHLSIPSESIMDEALSFTRYHLEAVAGQDAIAHHISRHIRNALYKPRFLKLEIAAAREYISFYEKEDHDETLLKFAKLNFNFCQLHYVRELKTLSKWDLGAIDELPSYLRIVIRSIMETMEDIEKEMKPRGRSSSVQYTIEEIKSMGRAYVDISKWARAGHVPTFDDYIEVGIASSGIRCFAMYSFIAMEDCDENITNEWFKSKPKILQALCVIFLLVNDIAGFEEEMRRGEVAYGVNCYMKQHNVTKELAVTEFKKMIRDNYKIMMEEFLTIRGLPRPILVRCLNIVRMINLYYEEGDGFTNPHGKLKDLITSLFFHPLQL